MAKVLVDLLQGGHYAFLEELPNRYEPGYKQEYDTLYRNDEPLYK